MGCEFKKQNGEGGVGNGQLPVIRPEIKRTVVIPRNQPELDRRRSARREQPRVIRKKPNNS